MRENKKMSLNEGSGRMPQEQAASLPNKHANLVIGLGEAGTDCLLEIHKKIRERGKWGNSIWDTMDETFIRLLAVDAIVDNSCIPEDITCISTRFDQNEFEKNTSQYVNSPEYAWLRYDRLSHAMKYQGERNIRQIARLGLFQNYVKLYEKVRGEILACFLDENTSKSRNIYIVAATGECIGSAIFLDVCYTVKEILRTEGMFANVFGMVCMPDVSLSKCFDEAEKVQIKCNGYATLQEMDFCMCLSHNGGGFQQQYSETHFADWKSEPVDLCFLIGASDGIGRILPNAYRNVMEMMAEQILDALGSQKEGYFHFLSKEYIAKFQMMVQSKEGEQIRGQNIRYASLSAAGAVLPLPQIGICLASMLFWEYTKQHVKKKPGKKEVDWFALQVFAPNERNGRDLFQALISEMKRGMFAKEFTRFDKDYREVLLDHRIFIRHFQMQWEHNLQLLDANVKRLADTKHDDSYMSRIHVQLQGLICGFQSHAYSKENLAYSGGFGAGFAYEIIDGISEYSFFHVIHDLLEKNKVRRMYLEQTQPARVLQYRNAEEVFLQRNSSGRGYFDTDRKRFVDYQNAMICYFQGKQDICVHHAIERVLTELRAHLVFRAENFYRILADAMRNLEEYFCEEASKADVLMKDQSDKNAFFMCMMAMKELKPAMEAKMRRLNVSDVISNLMMHFLDRVPEWMNGDEQKIRAFVVDFLTEDVFFDFMNKGISSFLFEKYGTTYSNQVAGFVVDDFIRSIAHSATHGFVLDSSAAGISPTQQSIFLIPKESEEIRMAVTCYLNERALDACSTQVIERSLFDRITIQRCMAGFPIGAFLPMEEYEQCYYKDVEMAFGMHLYEGESVGSNKSLSDMPCSDWNDLAPLRMSRYSMYSQNVPAFLARRTKQLEKMYENGMKLGVIGRFACDENGCDESRGDDHCLYAFSEKEILKLENDLEDFALKMECGKTWEGKHVKIGKTFKITREFTNVRLHCVGGENSKNKERIRMDFFFSSPAYQYIVRREIGKMRKISEWIHRLKECGVEVDLDFLEESGSDVPW